MSDSDYRAILNRALSEFQRAVREIRENEVKVAKLRQFINAGMNMLADDERAFFRAELDALASDENIRSVGLKEAIIRILAAQPRNWFSSAEVRDHLLESGFDFTAYKANPLASVCTTLKRMNSKEVETHTIEGVLAFRWQKTPREVLREQQQRLREENRCIEGEHHRGT